MSAEPTPDQSYCDVGRHLQCSGYTEDGGDAESCFCDCHDEPFRSEREAEKVRDAKRVMPEPVHGSIVLIYGITGTAYQRSFADGLWHATMGRDCGQPITWTSLLTRDRAQAPVLVHSALQ